MATILDFAQEDNQYDLDLIKEINDDFPTRYGGDWDRLERNFRGRYDIYVEDWSDDKVKACVEYVKSLYDRDQKQRKGIAEDAPTWFTTDDWLKNHTSKKRFWNTYLRYLYEEKHWSDESLNKLVSETRDIVNFLPNPYAVPPTTINGETDYSKFCKKGLVYGDVQAGKTGSMECLASMYADAGCKYIFVLSGITNNLRAQTQNRFVEELDIRRELPNLRNWKLLTSGENDQIPANFNFADGLGNNVAIGFFKKNPAALKRLMQYCQQITNANFWDDKQVLIIDDECDQYTPNVADLPPTEAEIREEEMLVDEETNEAYPHSRINELIINLLKYFPRVSYVGYTATPFANVLNDLPGEESIYPEDFIYALGKNKMYFGAEKIFKNSDDEDSKVMDMLREISMEDTQYLTKTMSDDGDPECPDSLKQAINYFLLAAATKRDRNLIVHSTMLIHINMMTTLHRAMQELVSAYIRELKNNFDSFCPELERLWNEEKDRNKIEDVIELFPEEKAENFTIKEFSELKDTVKTVLDKLEVIVDNSTVPEDQRLVYEKPETLDDCRFIIAIGGNTLSRGLTLEGLTVSYFVRASQTYDTLLQMGRWFGYRPQYEDVVRIWMTTSLINDFEILTRVIDSLRDEIEFNYGKFKTPRDFAPRILANSHLHISREAAIQRAEFGAQYSGDYIETSYLYRKDEDILKKNIKAAGKMFDSIKDKREEFHNAFFYRDCDSSTVLEFLKDYQFNPANNDCKNDGIADYIKHKNEKGSLKNWTIVLKQAKNGDPLKLSDDISVNMITRSCRKTDDEGTCYVRIHEPRDFKIDTSDDIWRTKAGSASLGQQLLERDNYYKSCKKETPGMLLVYPIDGSKAPASVDNLDKYEIDAPDAVIGLVFVFPYDRSLEGQMTASIRLNQE